MKTLPDLLAEYGESHTDHTNKLIHFICVPAIFWSICGILHTIKWNQLSPGILNGLDFPALMAVLIYYFRLSAKLSAGFLLWGIVCMAICSGIESNSLPLFSIALSVFAAAWTGQFIGHHIEGKKPSFLKDLQFLLIGPAWIMQFIYNNLGFKL